MKGLKIIFSIIALTAIASTSKATIVVMGGADSVVQDGSTTIINCGDDPSAVCAVIETTKEGFTITPDGSQSFEATDYKTVSNPDKSTSVVAQVKN